ncbi:MAG: hypothetical protein IH933_07965 [Euryarchaeota archaeon]|nr:hypothetical protein [Euryarchaeota archaeon]
MNRRYIAVALVCFAIVLAGCTGWGTDGPAEGDDPEPDEADALEGAQDDTNDADGEDAADSDDAGDTEESDETDDGDGDADVESDEDTDSAGDTDDGDTSSESADAGDAEDTDDAEDESSDSEDGDGAGEPADDDSDATDASDDDSSDESDDSTADESDGTDDSSESDDADDTDESAENGDESDESDDGSESDESDESDESNGTDDGENGENGGDSDGDDETDQNGDNSEDGTDDNDTETHTLTVETGENGANGAVIAVEGDDYNETKVVDEHHDHSHGVAEFDLPAGEYVVHGVDENGDEQTEYVNLTTDETVDLHTLQSEWPDAVDFDVVVEDEDGEPVNDAHIQLDGMAALPDGTTPVYETETGDDGVGSGNVYAGTYDLSVHHGDFNVYDEEIVIDGDGDEFIVELEETVGDDEESDDTALLVAP